MPQTKEIVRNNYIRVQ